MTAVGIDSLSFYVPGHYLGLDVLAEKQGIDPLKFSNGLGQEKIAVPGHDEDIVTMAAEAARKIIDARGIEGIDTVLFATETGIDQSKCAGIYVHELLGLSPKCRSVELKQACYSGTAAIQMACGLVARKPTSKVLILASDISRYELDSAAEATQGAGAVAILISANPSILEIDLATGCYTEDIMDFWRPNYSKTPMVDGKYSMNKYLEALHNAWQDYQDNGGASYADISRFCYHLPFTKMGVKAHRHLAKLNASRLDAASYIDGLTYNRQTGNCYAAALYLSLISTLENSEDDLTGRTIGLFSYGSGAVSEFFSGKVQAGYQEQLFVEYHQQLLQDRQPLNYQEYLEYWHAPEGKDGGETINEYRTKGRYRLARYFEHKRDYQNAELVNDEG